MRLLLDTHALLWALSDPERLDEEARSVVRDGRNEVLASVASAWEIAIKRASGKLKAPGDLLETAEAAEIGWLSISVAHATVAAALPRHHRGSFDRMLVAQARVESLILATRDGRLEVHTGPHYWRPDARGR